VGSGEDTVPKPAGVVAGGVSVLVDTVGGKPGTGRLE
jgi:hypothetical protein